MKRIISVLCFALILLTGFSMNVYAEGECTVGIEEKTASPAECVTLEVFIKNNSGITAMYLDVYYDDGLTLISAEDTGLFDGGMFSEDISSMPFCLSWDESLKEKENTSDGVIARLVFRVPENSAGKSYNVKISYDANEVFDSALKNIPIRCDDGCVRVTDTKESFESSFAELHGDYLYTLTEVQVGEILDTAPRGTEIKNGNTVLSDDAVIKNGFVVTIPDEGRYECVCLGDADCDGKIKAADARLCLRESVGLEKLSGSIKRSCDTDADGRITATDARSILRAAVKLENPSDWLRSYASGRVSAQKHLSNKIFSDEDAFNNAGQYVISRLKEFQTDIDISAYNISTKDAEALLMNFIYCTPSLFYVDSHMSYSYSDGLIHAVHFRLSDNAEEKAAEYSLLIDELVNKADKGMTPLETALFYHEYLVMNFSYDTNNSIFDAYTMLKERKGVCQAYSLLYAELLSAHGIDVRHVTSDKMNHAWNVVKIGSSWYHADVTWDDPVRDKFAKVNHKYFLLSDSALRAEGHHSWDVVGEDVTCDSEKYDSFFWSEVNSPIAVSGGKYYFISEKNGKYYLTAADSRGSSAVLSEIRAHQDDESAEWYGYYSSVVSWNGRIIYNTDKCIVSYAPDTREKEILYEEKSGLNIYGIIASDDIYYLLSSSCTSYGDDIRGLGLTRAGDVYPDGRINAKDVTILIRYISSFKTDAADVSIDAADYNGDDTVNITDAEELRYFIVNGYNKV